MFAQQLCQLTQTDSHCPASQSTAPSLRFRRRKRMLFVMPDTPCTSRASPECVLLEPVLHARTQPRTAMSLSRLNREQTPSPEPYYSQPTPAHHSPSFAPSPLRHISPLRPLEPRFSPRSHHFLAYLQVARKVPGENLHLRSFTRPKPLYRREKRRLPMLRLVSMQFPVQSSP